MWTSFLHLGTIEKLYFEPSQIATVTNCDTIIAICDLSQFVIKALTWHIDSITLKTCSGYLGEYPCLLLTWIWKVAFLPILVLFHWYICWCVCISVIKLIIDVPRKPSWKGPILMWTCFLHLGLYPRLLCNRSEKLRFEPSQNCDSNKLRQFRNICRRNLWFVAICDHGRDSTNGVQ